jgi:hypothetical protein
MTILLWIAAVLTIFAVLVTIWEKTFYWRQNRWFRREWRASHKCERDCEKWRKKQEKWLY